MRNRYHDQDVPATGYHDGDDGGVSERRVARLDIVALIQQTRALNLEERGFYLTALLHMMNRMEPMPADDRQAMHIVGCSIKEYRRLKRRMVDLGKMSNTDGRLTSRLAERETADYKAECVKRRTAGLNRERFKKIATNSDSDLSFNTEGGVGHD